MLDNKTRLIAHRGGKGYGVENTKEAFIKAIENDYYGVECDIQPTKDNVLIVCHDLSLHNLLVNSNNLHNDVTSIKDKPINELLYKEIKDLELTKKDVDGNIFYGQILTFKEFLSIMKDSNLVLFIELKESFTEELLDQVLNELKEMEIDNNRFEIIANLASIDLLVALRKKNKDLKLQFVARTDYQLYIDTCINHNIGLDVCYTVFRDNYELALSILKKFQDKKISTNVWVINQIALLNEFIELGFDYFTTDLIKPNEIN